MYGCVDTDGAASGVLDIFGFEFYENDDLMPYQLKVVNGLDQLNINICNEMLQQVFVGVRYVPHSCQDDSY